ncbi:MAG: GGDEF domain-containing protein, partial [Rhizobacter sp.]|nr:GGDEF domain-containing protein [Rhizobacter sp.]
MRKSLSARIVLLFLGLLLLVQGLSFVAIRATIDRNARAAVAEDLLVGERLLKRVLDQNAQKLTEGATLLAADYGFRSAVSSNDAATIADVLANHGERIGASVAVLLDTSFRLRAAAQADVSGLKPLLDRLAANGGSAKRDSDVVVINNTPFQFVMVPLRAPVLVGWVLMGFPVDQRLLDEMRTLSSLHVSLEVQRDPQSAWKTTVSTLPQTGRIALERQNIFLPGAPAMSLRLPDGEYSARAVALAEPGGSAVSAVLMRSVDEAVAPYRQLQLGLAVLTLLSVAVFGVGSVETVVCQADCASRCTSRLMCSDESVRISSTRRWSTGKPIS